MIWESDAPLSRALSLFASPFLYGYYVNPEGLAKAKINKKCLQAEPVIMSRVEFDLEKIICLTSC